MGFRRRRSIRPAARQERTRRPGHLGLSAGRAPDTPQNHRLIRRNQTPPRRGNKMGSRERTTAASDTPVHPLELARDDAVIISTFALSAPACWAMASPPARSATCRSLNFGPILFCRHHRSLFQKPAWRPGNNQLQRPLRRVPGARSAAILNLHRGGGQPSRALVAYMTDGEQHHALSSSASAGLTREIGSHSLLRPLGSCSTWA